MSLLRDSTPLRFYTPVFLLILFCLAGNATAQVSSLTRELTTAPWKATSLRPGLTWRQCLFDGLFASPQSLNVLEWNPEGSSLRLCVAYRDSVRATVSEMADSAGAVAAINGGFFSVQHGWAVSFLRSGDSTVARSRNGEGVFVNEAAIAMDRKGKVSLAQQPQQGWEAGDSAYSEAMASGPLLLLEGRIVAQEATPFNLKRHPRSGIGFRPDGSLLFITADGRAEQAAGLTTLEFARLFQALGCHQALNLDGGGSTTLWIRDQGVVNYPSDNKQFDHQGERPVANALLLCPVREGGRGRK